MPAVEVPLPGLRLELFDAEPDADADAEALPDADADPEVAGLAALVAVDVGVAVGHDVPVAVAVFLLPVGLPLAGGETVAEAVAVPVVVVAVALPPGLTLLAGVPLSPLLVLPLGGVGGELAGVPVGVTDLLGVVLVDGEALVGHAGTFGLLWPMVPTLWPRVPLVEPCRVAVPARLGTSPGALCDEVIPTAVLSW